MRFLSYSLAKEFGLATEELYLPEKESGSAEEEFGLAKLLC
ncbi:hypothetical protein [Candidatus Electronema sp. PJ]